MTTITLDDCALRAMEALCPEQFRDGGNYAHDEVDTMRSNEVACVESIMTYFNHPLDPTLRSNLARSTAWWAGYILGWRERDSVG